MPSLEDDLASYDRAEILEYLAMLKTAEEVCRENRSH